MHIIQRVIGGCLLLPVLLVGSCAGKMTFDSWRYELPSEVLKSQATPTEKLRTPLQIANALDSYVQPRFEILRDKNFGAMRIVYRKHAGIVQLKVDTPEEKEKIANVNAAQQDYAICLLHCAPQPEHGYRYKDPEIQLLYFNQQQVAGSPLFSGFSLDEENTEARSFKENALKFIEAKAVAVLPKLMTGKEQTVQTAKWSILMRPVPAKQDCLTCHTTAKLGGTLGVMVYAVRNTKKVSSPRAE